MTASWVGSRLNIDIARHVYHILVRESARAYREAKREAAFDIDRTAFMRGFFWAVSQKLAERPLRNDLDEAIRNAERKLLELQRENGRFQVSRSNAGKGGIDVDALASGFAAGQGVNLARPCEGRGGSPLAIGGGNPLRLAM